MSDATTWKIKPHTLAKHILLRRYLGAWFPILTIGGHNRRVIYLDGFAGPGRYSENEPGSPIIALDTLINHSHFSQMTHTEFIFAFVEQDPDRYHSLQGELEAFWNLQGEAPSNVEVRPYNEPFEDVARYITAAAHGKLAPTLAFVDPFGWSGVAMRTIGELLGSRKCEVLFNFMHESINRFVSDTRVGTTRSLAELFGTDDFVHHQASTLRERSARASCATYTYSSLELSVPSNSCVASKSSIKAASNSILPYVRNETPKGTASDQGGHVGSRPRAG